MRVAEERDVEEDLGIFGKAGGFRIYATVTVCELENYIGYHDDSMLVEVVADDMHH